MRDILFMARLLGEDRSEVRKLVDLARTNGKFVDFARNGLRKMCKEESIDINNPNPFLPRQRAEELQVKDGIRIGQAHDTGFPVFISKSELTRGVLIIGAHGSGKTNLGYWLAQELENGA